MLRRIALYSLQVLLCAGLALPMAVQAQSDVQQLEARIPVWVPGKDGTPAHTANLVGHVYRPQGAGPWGLVVLSHGTPGGADARAALTDRYGAQARAIAALGYVVVTGLRRGYGASDGPLADRYGSCDAPDYAHAAQEAARDVAAIMTYGQKLPYVDGSNVVLMGKSAGGFASLALAAQQPAGIRGVINFAGGRGAQPQMRARQTICSEAALLQTIASFAATARVPMLWVYAENDSYFRPTLVEEMAKRYQKASARLNLEVNFVAPENDARKEGHGYFDRTENINFWLPIVRDFLMRNTPGRASAQLLKQDIRGDES
jgi:dienelactone hydrolase